MIMMREILRMAVMVAVVVSLVELHAVAAAGRTLQWAVPVRVRIATSSTTEFSRSL